MPLPSACSWCMPGAYDDLGIGGALPPDPPWRGFHGRSLCCCTLALAAPRPGSLRLGDLLRLLIVLLCLARFASQVHTLHDEPGLETCAAELYGERQRPRDRERVCVCESERRETGRESERERRLCVRARETERERLSEREREYE